MEAFVKGIAITLGISVVTALGFEGHAQADNCAQAAAAYAAGHPHATAIYWDGVPTYLQGTEETAATGELFYYVPANKAAATDKDLGVPAVMSRDGEPADGARQLPAPVGCPTLFYRVYRRFAVTCEADPAARGCDGQIEVTPGALLDAYRGSARSRIRSQNRDDNGVPRGLPSVASVAGEAAQILGQIVSDRASQTAYALLTRKLLGWMHCHAEQAAAATTPFMTFPFTCVVIENLRLQDLALASALVRQALAADALAFLLPDPRPNQPASAQPASAPPAPSRDGVAVQRSTFGASSEPARSTSLEPFTFLRAGLKRRLVPLLSRPLEVLTGRSAEVEIRDIVDQALAKIASNNTEAFCALKNQDRVLGTAALAFAACELRGSDMCPVMQYVRELDATCTAHLATAQLTYAQSIAGHLFDARFLQKADTHEADGKERLIAASEAAFEIACMYAVPVDDGTGYECRVDESAHGAPLAATETVALARDLVRAALDRDGAGLAAVIIRTAVRVLPPANERSEPKAIRALATIAAYTATYTSTDPSKDAHQQRTALLESLTRDMTVRTDRGGDVIVGLGGALRGVGGVRMGRSTDGSRPTAIASPLSLTLGFGLDYLFERNTQGLHLEVSVLDLGQYLALDEGGKVTTPDLSVALSPSFTIAYFWQRNIPLYIGATVGYTPSYDFAPDGDQPQGAFTAGLTLGAYVPLFDFN